MTPARLRIVEDRGGYPERYGGEGEGEEEEGLVLEYSRKLDVIESDQT